MREEARKEREQRREGIVESTEEQGGGQTVKERGDEGLGGTDQHSVSVLTPCVTTGSPLGRYRHPERSQERT